MTDPTSTCKHMKSSLEARSQVAAAAASVIPFHCVICFDEFNLTDRPPVILPCGHTYVCRPCSKRLKRCMECREPLFVTTSVPKSPPLAGRAPPPAPSMYGSGSGRYSPQHPSTPPQTGPAQGHSSPVQTALPVPKNLVLMALMEAAQRQAREAEREAIENQTSTEHGSEDEEEYDLNRIISGMATLSGPCGTYAVRDPDGLAVVPFYPQKDLHDDIEEQDEKKLDEELKEKGSREPYSLEHGQTLQVVNFEDGVAKLAREEGYVVATSSQLVKGRSSMDTVRKMSLLIIFVHSFKLKMLTTSFSCFSPLLRSRRAEGQKL